MQCGPGVSSVTVLHLGSRSECEYFRRNDDPPKPESQNELVEDVAAFDKGAWQPNSSRHARDIHVDTKSLEGGATVSEAKPGMATMKMAYLCSGVKRKASIAE